MVWEVEEYSTAVSHFLLGLSTKTVECCTPKICFGIVHGLLEKRSELVRLVASVQKAVKEELEFLRDVLRIRAELMDAEDIPKYQA
jgi:hypothetical protein